MWFTICLLLGVLAIGLACFGFFAAFATGNLFWLLLVIPGTFVISYGFV